MLRIVARMVHTIHRLLLPMCTFSLVAERKHYSGIYSVPKEDKQLFRFGAEVETASRIEVETVSRI